jgi:hypothetical protein
MNEAQDIHMRMAPGDIFPSGECTECGAFCWEETVAEKHWPQDVKKNNDEKKFSSDNATTIHLTPRWEDEIVVNSICWKVTDCKCDRCDDCEKQACEGVLAWIPESTNPYIKQLLTASPELLEQLEILSNAVSNAKSISDQSLQAQVNIAKKLIGDIWKLKNE